MSKINKNWKILIWGVIGSWIFSISIAYLVNPKIYCEYGIASKINMIIYSILFFFIIKAILTLAVELSFMSNIAVVINIILIIYLCPQLVEKYFKLQAITVAIAIIILLLVANNISIKLKFNKIVIEEKHRRYIHMYLKKKFKKEIIDKIINENNDYIKSLINNKNELIFNSVNLMYLELKYKKYKKYKNFEKETLEIKSYLKEINKEIKFFSMSFYEPFKQISEDRSFYEYNYILKQYIKRNFGIKWAMRICGIIMIAVMIKANITFNLEVEPIKFLLNVVKVIPGINRIFPWDLQGQECYIILIGFVIVLVSSWSKNAKKSV